MVTIKLLGEAGRQFTRELKLDIHTPVEAIAALEALFPGFRRYLLDSDARGIRWRVVSQDPQGMSEAQLVEPVTDRLILAPIVSGRAPVGLLLAGLTLGGIGAAAGVPILLNLGLALVFQGIAGLLSPGQDRRTANRRTSFLFTAQELGTVQGTFVPVLYGEAMIQSAPVLSYGLSLEAGA